LGRFFDWADFSIDSIVPIFRLRGVRTFVEANFPCMYSKLATYHVSPTTKQILLCGLFLGLCVAATAQLLPRRARLPAELNEVSGMARLPNGTLWLLNDGGNSSTLYHYDPLTGRILDYCVLPVQNRDWEELCADPQGHLYIADVGNNGNRRRDLRIYRYDPETGGLDSILFHYPDQQAFPPAGEKARNFDCEAMVFFRDSLHLFTKSRFKGDFWCKRYVLPAQPGTYAAQLRDSVRLKNRVVTGAALSRDGQTLALSAYVIGKKWGFIPFTKASVFYFSGFEGSRFFNGQCQRRRLPKCFIARQFESILEWRPGQWIAANERRWVQRARIFRLDD
jgi:hypothetical protein